MWAVLVGRGSITAALGTYSATGIPLIYDMPCPGTCPLAGPGLLQLCTVCCLVLWQHCEHYVGTACCLLYRAQCRHSRLFGLRCHMKSSCCTACHSVPLQLATFASWRQNAFRVVTCSLLGQPVSVCAAVLSCHLLAFLYLLSFESCGYAAATACHASEVAVDAFSRVVAGLVAVEGATGRVLECEEVHIRCKSCALNSLRKLGRNPRVSDPK